MQLATTENLRGEISENRKCATIKVHNHLPASSQPSGEWAMNIVIDPPCTRSASHAAAQRKAACCAQRTLWRLLWHTPHQPLHGLFLPTWTKPGQLQGLPPLTLRSLSPIIAKLQQAANMLIQWNLSTPLGPSCLSSAEMWLYLRGSFAHALLCGWDSRQCPH